jgi:hypothetical protein
MPYLYLCRPSLIERHPLHFATYHETQSLIFAILVRSSPQTSMVIVLVSSFAILSKVCKMYSTASDINSTQPQF